MNKIINNKKILIIVPHQDDEINIAGGLIYTYSKNNDIKVVYTTNGDYVTKADIRYKEAIKSLKKLGIRKDSIIFLGYSDQSYNGKSHMYNTENIWTSKQGRKNTYGAMKINEWSYLKNNIHNEFKKENLVKDLKEIIIDFKPEIIICVDLDYHPDHIMTSLCFEKALGEILHERQGYQPLVLKTMAYEKAYLGENDFNKLKVEEMKFKWNNQNLLNNPYYEKDKQIKLPILNKTYSLNLFINPIWKAINMHKSQLLLKNAFNIINSNIIYFKRNTQNLLNTAVINVSSSNKEFLYDFLLCDTSNVLNGDKEKIKYDKGIWIPEKDDSKKEIEIIFKEEKDIESIKLYNGLINDSKIKEICIKIDDKDYQNYKLSNKYINEINIDKKLNKIVIKVLDDIVENGFSEIEIIEKGKENEFNINCFIKAIIDEKWTDNYIFNNKEKCLIEIYSINKNISLKDICIDTSKLKNGKIKDNYLYINRKSKGFIKFYLKENDSIFDIVHINKNRKLNKYLIRFNEFYLKIKILWTRVIKKIFIRN